MSPGVVVLSSLLACSGKDAAPSPSDDDTAPSDTSAPPKDSGDDTAVDDTAPDTGPLDADGDGFSPADGDCDDADDAVYPGAPDACGDGLDADCDGADTTCFEDRLDLSTAPLVVRGAEADAIGLVASGDDLTGDGVMDLLIGVPQREVDGEPRGMAVVVSGARSGVVSVDDADALFAAEPDGYRAGGAVFLPGDLDGDGYPDLLISDPFAGTTVRRGGVIYAVHGPVSGANLLADADGMVLGEYGDAYGGDYLGNVLSGRGDIDGDGRPDFIGTSAVTYDAILVQGPLEGAMLLSEADVLFSLEDGHAYPDIVKDVDGDGLDDVLLGATGDDTTATSAGLVALMLGPLSGLVTLDDSEATWLGLAANDEAGYPTTDGGDLDGDGLGDLLAGAGGDSRGGENAGAVYLLLGTTRGEHSVDEALAVFYAEGEERYKALAARSTGDADGDGFDDLIVGHCLDDLDGEDAGAVWWLPGPFEGVSRLDDVGTRVSGAVAGIYLGSVVASPGDLDGDGLGELIVSATREGSGGELAGAISLLGDGWAGAR